MQQAFAQAGFEERRFFTGEIHINYVVGPDNGTPLILIPAQTGIWESYEAVMLPLSRRFQVYVVDIRGHGKSDWTTGDYSWASVGRDLTAFLKQVVKRPALVSGNSSGGIIALWLAANVADYTAGIVLEDAPVFSVEMPRFKEVDRFVYQGLERLVENIGDPKNRDIAHYFKNQELPVNQGRRSKRMPDWFVRLLSWLIRRYEKAHPGEPVDIGWFPASLRVLVKSVSMFDPDFARAFVDGRFYEGINHAEALKRVTCPVLVLHANWFRHPKFGLVGAMDDDDAKRIQALVPQAQYQKIPANHVIHFYKPQAFVQAIESFAERVGLLSGAQLQPQNAT